MPEPKHPDVHVRLIGEDGNAYSILGRVSKAMKREGISAEEIAEFMTEAKSGDYNHLLRTVVKYVNTDGDDDEDGDYWS